MAASANRMKLKNTPMDTWSTRERLCLGSSVMRSGDQNWVSVSRAIKPFGENNRPTDWFSQKNCARQYADLLEKVETPKRKRGERGEIETPGESIVRKLTLERIEELKTLIQQEQQQHYKLRTEIDMIQTGHFDDKLQELWQQVLEEKKKEEQAVLDHQKWIQDREAAKVALLTAPKSSKMPSTPISKQPKKTMKNPRTAAMRRSSSQSEPGSEPESTSNSPLHEALNVEVDIPSIVPKPPQPTSPLLTSLLKSPTAASGFSILHSAITQPKDGGRMAPTTSTSAISTLLGSSPCKSNLLASAFNLDPEIPTRPPTTSPSAGAPTLSRLLEMPLASPGKPLPPLPVVTPEAEQSPPIEATPDSSTDTQALRQEERVELEQTEVTSTCAPSDSTQSITEEVVSHEPSDNVVTEVTVTDEPEQIPVVSESVVVTDCSSAEAEPSNEVKEEPPVSEIMDIPAETEPEHIPEEASTSSLDLKLEETEEVVIEETASVEIKEEEPEMTTCTEVEIQDEDFQVVQEELVEEETAAILTGQEVPEVIKEDALKMEEVEDTATLPQEVDEEVKSEDAAETSKVVPDEESKPSSPIKEEPDPEPEPESESEVRSETPSSVKEMPSTSKPPEPTRGRGRGRGRGRRSFPSRVLHHSGSNDSKPKDSPKPETDDDDDSDDEIIFKKSTDSGKAREKTTKGREESESKDRDDRTSAKKEDGRSKRRDEGKNRKEEAKGKKTELKEDGKGRKSDAKDDGKGKKSDGKEDGKGRKSEGKDDGRGRKSDGKEDGRRRKSDGKEDGRGRKSEGKDDTKGKKKDGKEDGKDDGKGKKTEGKETADDERSRSRKRSSKDDDAKDTKVSKKEEVTKEKKVDGRRRKILPTSVDNTATQDVPKLPSKVAEIKEEPQVVSSDIEDSPEPETPKMSRRGKEKRIEREDSLPDTDDDKFSERDESSNLSKLFPSDSIPNSPASNAQSDDHEGLRDYKVWKKAIMLVWRSAATHKFANVFLHPVTEEVAPGYKVVVYRPMDLSQIKKNIENGVIKTTAEFQRDMMLMFQNAIMYNSSDHDVYTMAVEMQKEVMCHIQDFLATQLMVQTAEVPKALRRETRELAQKRTSESFTDIKQADDAKRSGSESEGSKPKKRRMRTADD